VVPAGAATPTSTTQQIRAALLQLRVRRIRLGLRHGAVRHRCVKLRLGGSQRRIDDCLLGATLRLGDLRQRLAVVQLRVQLVFGQVQRLCRRRNDRVPHAGDAPATGEAAAPTVPAAEAPLTALNARFERVGLCLRQRAVGDRIRRRGACRRADSAVKHRAIDAERFRDVVQEQASQHVHGRYRRACRRCCVCRCAGRGPSTNRW